MFQTRSIEYHAVKGLAIIGLILGASNLTQRLFDFTRWDFLYHGWTYYPNFVESVAENSLLFIGSWGLCRHHSWARRCLLVWGFCTIPYTTFYMFVVQIASYWHQTNAPYNTFRMFMFLVMWFFNFWVADIAFPLIALFVLMNRDIANICSEPKAPQP